MIPNLSSRFFYPLERKRWAILSTVAFLCSISSFSSSTHASIDAVSKEEYQLLPAYCRNQSLVASQYYKPDNAEGWKNALGATDYHHIHHVCWGLVQMMRAYKLGPSSRRGISDFTSAINNFRYSLDRSPDGSLLRPELLTKIGEAYLGLRDYRKAGDSFRNAIAENPTYPQPYILWAHALMKNGKSQEALAIAGEGKKNNPNSKSLSKLMEDIKRAGKN